MRSSKSPHLVQFIHCRTDGAELVIWDTAHGKHPVEDAPVVDLQMEDVVTEMTTQPASSFCKCNWVDGTNLDTEVSEVQIAEDFMDDLQTLSIWNHGVVLPCYVEILKHTHK